MLPLPLPVPRNRRRRIKNVVAAPAGENANVKFVAQPDKSLRSGAPVMKCVNTV